jgi:methylamine dehydrogenase light chain
MNCFDFDKIGEKFTRRLAGKASRRSIISRLGAALVAAPVFPLLPIDRASAQPVDPTKLSDFQKKAQIKDDTECNYWRYCAIDGSLCTCCGGTTSMCPPGTSPSLTSWVGTCYNPDDKRSYLIAYRDCCGTSGCGRCHCDNTEEATPAYRPQGNNEIIWCFGTSSMAYHCSTAALVGVAS